MFKALKKKSHKISSSTGRSSKTSKDRSASTEPDSQKTDGLTLLEDGQKNILQEAITVEDNRCLEKLKTVDYDEPTLKKDDDNEGKENDIERLDASLNDSDSESRSGNEEEKEKIRNARHEQKNKFTIRGILKHVSTNKKHSLKPDLSKDVGDFPLNDKLFGASQLECKTCKELTEFIEVQQHTIKELTDTVRRDRESSKLLEEKFQKEIQCISDRCAYLEASNQKLRDIHEKSQGIPESHMAGPEKPTIEDASSQTEERSNLPDEHSNMKVQDLMKRLKVLELERDSLAEHLKLVTMELRDIKQKRLVYRRTCLMLIAEQVSTHANQQWEDLLPYHRNSFEANTLHTSPGDVSCCGESQICSESSLEKSNRVHQTMRQSGGLGSNISEQAQSGKSLGHVLGKGSATPQTDNGKVLSLNQWQKPYRIGNAKKNGEITVKNKTISPSHKDSGKGKSKSPQVNQFTLNKHFLKKDLSNFKDLVKTVDVSAIVVEEKDSRFSLLSGYKSQQNLRKQVRFAEETPTLCEFQHNAGYEDSSEPASVVSSDLQNSDAKIHNAIREKAVQIAGFQKNENFMKLSSSVNSRPVNDTGKKKQISKLSQKEFCGENISGGRGVSSTRKSKKPSANFLSIVSRHKLLSNKEKVSQKTKEELKQSYQGSFETLLSTLSNENMSPKYYCSDQEFLDSSRFKETFELSCVKNSVASLQPKSCCSEDKYALNSNAARQAITVSQKKDLLPESNTILVKTSSREISLLLTQISEHETTSHLDSDLNIDKVDDANKFKNQTSVKPGSGDELKERSYQSNDLNDTKGNKKESHGFLSLMFRKASMLTSHPTRNDIKNEFPKSSLSVASASSLTSQLPLLLLHESSQEQDDFVDLKSQTQDLTLIPSQNQGRESSLAYSDSLAENAINEMSNFHLIHNKNLMNCTGKKEDFVSNDRNSRDQHIHEVEEDIQKNQGGEKQEMKDSFVRDRKLSKTQPQPEKCWDLQENTSAHVMNGVLVVMPLLRSVYIELNEKRKSLDVVCLSKKPLYDVLMDFESLDEDISETELAKRLLHRLVRYAMALQIALCTHDGSRENSCFNSSKYNPVFWLETILKCVQETNDLNRELKEYRFRVKELHSLLALERESKKVSLQHLRKRLESSHVKINSNNSFFSSHPKVLKEPSGFNPGPTVMSKQVFIQDPVRFKLPFVRNILPIKIVPSASTISVYPIHSTCRSQGGLRARPMYRPQ